MITKKEILEVLNYIKKECDENECRDCAFYSHGNCEIQHAPKDWRLKEHEEEEKWTPFKN